MKSAAFRNALFSLVLVAIFSFNVAAQVSPAVAHNKETATAALPDGDLFALPSQLNFQFTAAMGNPTVAPFFVNSTTFGDGAVVDKNSGFLSAEQRDQARGVGIAGKGVFYKADIPCLVKPWDWSFKVARTGNKGSAWLVLWVGGQVAAIIDIHSHTAALGQIAPGAEIYTNRLAGGPQATLLQEFPYGNNNAGNAGRATGLLTMSLPGFMHCDTLGFSLKTSDDFDGTVSFVSMDIVLMTMEQTGDRQKSATGLLSGVRAWVPTQNPCGNTCTPPQCVPPPPIDKPSDVQVCPVCAVPFWVGRYSITQFARSNSELVAELLSRDKDTNVASDQLLAHLLSFEQMLRLANCNAGIQNTPFDNWPIDCQLPGYTVGRLIRESMQAIWAQDNAEAARLLPAMKSFVKKTKFN